MIALLRWRGGGKYAAGRLGVWQSAGKFLSGKFCPVIAAILLVLVFSAVPAANSKPQQKGKLPPPRQLDQAITWQRNSATGEITVLPRTGGAVQQATAPAGASAIRVETQMVPVTCSVYASDGAAVPGLDRTNFHVYDNGVEQEIEYFDASSAPASIALVIDASPSVLRDSDQMKKAATVLVESLAPLDKAAVVDFAAHTYVQLPFSDAREMIRRAVARIDVRQMLGDTGGSNIYDAVYLTAHELFAGRTGRKAIVLLTDGQDSGLGLRFDGASSSPSDERENRLTFDDVSRLLTAEDIQLFAVSTENRPKAMTPDWLEARRAATLLTPDARRLGIPPYTLYLAEMVRRTGGQLSFLRESDSMADAFRRIAQNIRAEYTLGYYPAADSGAGIGGLHQLKVEVAGPADVAVIHRMSYYVAAR